MTTGISTLGQSLAQTTRLKAQQTTLAEYQLQLTTGKKTQEFSGLGTNAIISQRARADFNALDTYINNIAMAETRLNMMSVSIKELTAQAGNIANVIAGELSEGEINLKTVNDLSSNIISFMENLINTQSGDRYLFSGSATTSPPLSMSTGTLETYIQGQLKTWQDSGISTDTLITNYRNTSDTIIGYNAELSAGTAGNVSVRADKTTSVDYTTLANADGFKNIIIAVQTLSELSQTDSTNPFYIDKIKLEESDYEGASLPTDLPKTPPPATNLTLPADFTNSATLGELRTENQTRAEAFFAVFNDLGKMINQSIDDLDQLRFNIENDRARLNSIKEQHEIDRNTLLSSVSDVEDADINEVALSLNFLQIQLEASYRVTSSVSKLTLSNYL